MLALLAFGHQGEGSHLPGGVAAERLYIYRRQLEIAHSLAGLRPDLAVDVALLLPASVVRRDLALEDAAHRVAELDVVLGKQRALDHRDLWSGRFSPLAPVREPHGPP